MKSIKITGRIISARYKSSSFAGNPKYYVSFEDLSTGKIFFGETANNAACAYGVNNSEYKTASVIKYHVTRNNNIILDFLYKE